MPLSTFVEGVVEKMCGKALPVGEGQSPLEKGKLRHLVERVVEDMCKNKDEPLQVLAKDVVREMDEERRKEDSSSSWTKVVDGQRGVSYYFKSATGEKVWNLPVGSLVVLPPANEGASGLKGAAFTPPPPPSPPKERYIIVGSDGSRRAFMEGGQQKQEQPSPEPRLATVKNERGILELLGGGREAGGLAGSQPQRWVTNPIWES